MKLLEAEQVGTSSTESLLVEGLDRVMANVSDPSKGKKLVLEEERAMGRVPKAMVFGYIKQMGGPFLVTLLITSCIFLELVSLGNTFFVGMWSGRYLLCANQDLLLTIVDAYRQPDQVNANLWLAAYACLLFGTTLATGITYGLWYWAQFTAARVFHEKLLKAVLFAPIRFFDTTPVGRIINRFSKDVKYVYPLVKLETFC